MPEAITKYAVNSTLGTSKFLPLDQIIQNLTNVKIQNVTFEMNVGSSGGYKDVTIDAIDISKSIIIPISYFNLEKLTNVSYNFQNNTTVRCTARASAVTAFDASVIIITFGGNVVNS